MPLPIPYKALPSEHYPTHHPFMPLSLPPSPPSLSAIPSSDTYPAATIHTVEPLTQPLDQPTLKKTTSSPCVPLKLGQPPSHRGQQGAAQLYPRSDLRAVIRGEKRKCVPEWKGKRFSNMHDNKRMSISEEVQTLTLAR